MGIALRQTAGNAGITVTTEINFTNPVYTGDLVGAFVSSQNSVSSSNAPVVSDSNGDSAISGLGWYQGTSLSMGVTLFGVAAGNTTFGLTFTFSSEITFQIIMFNLSGVNIASPVDGSASAVATGTSTSPSTASLTPSQNGDYQLGFILTSGATGGVTWTNGLTALSNHGFSWLGGQLLSSESAIDASATFVDSTTWAMAQLLLAPAPFNVDEDYEWTQYVSSGTLSCMQREPRKLKHWRPRPRRRTADLGIRRWLHQNRAA